MAAPVPIPWDSNQTNTAAIPSPLQTDGYADDDIPSAKTFNTFWNNVYLCLLYLMNNKTFTTGDVKTSFNPTPNDGFILMMDGSIGSPSSGATIRANADTEDLYTLWWNSYANSEFPVSGGRGASAAADFAANKPMSITATGGVALINHWGINTAKFPRAGVTYGEWDHANSEAENGPHGHGVPVPPGGQGFMIHTASPTGTGTTDNGIDTILGEGPLSTDTSGSGAPHNNVQPSKALYMHIAL